MKTNIIAAALIVWSTCSLAFTVDEARFFAYTYHPQLKLNVMLSRNKCPINGKGWNGYAETYQDTSGITRKSCWAWYDEKETVLSVCAISIKDNKAGNCIFYSKEYFRDVSTLPKSAFK